MKCCPFLFFMHVEILEHTDMTKSFKKEKGIGKEKHDKYSTQKKPVLFIERIRKNSKCFQFFFQNFLE